MCVVLSLCKGKMLHNIHILRVCKLNVFTGIISTKVYLFYAQFDQLCTSQRPAHQSKCGKDSRKKEVFVTVYEATLGEMSPVGIFHF